jgi:hypothetical protein
VLLTTCWLVYITIVVVVARNAMMERRAEKNLPVNEQATVGMSIAGFVLFFGGFCVPSLLLAFILRGGFTFSILGVRVRNRAHALASRWRCLLRAAVNCLPLLLLLVPVTTPALSKPVYFLAAGILAALIYLAGAAWGIMRPTEGVADTIARTRLVPR